MNSITIGQNAPDIQFYATNNLNLRLNDYLGKVLIVFFYPKDATPGCTIESQNFRDSYQLIKEMNAELLGISRDSLKSHERFKLQHNLPFELIADTDEHFCKLFDVIKEKNMYGKKVRGIERSTFVFNQKGVLVKEWRKVAVPGHVQEVINFLKHYKLEINQT